MKRPFIKFMSEKKERKTRTAGAVCASAIKNVSGLRVFLVVQTDVVSGLEEEISR